ncbi:MAG: response regulator transcription factor [Chitinophagales bacterium]|nr:response regulator transcription factor [Chitinophagaceae bacterium]MBP9882434.1 response regulator transcription factor [Chitinophagales bacterium]
MKNKIKIVIADDHQIFIEGIKSLIKDSEKVLLVGEARDGETLLHVLKAKNPDVVLMDVNMPKMSGIEASKKIRLLFPDIKILGLTMSDDADSVSEMMRAGALGYLLKTTSKAELISAIVHVNNGEKYLSAEMSMKLIEKMFDDNEKEEVERIPRKADITKRELDIVRLIAQEMTNVEIAKKLNNSPMTIITHRKNLLRKLGVKNTAGLVKYAVMNGLLES